MYIERLEDLSLVYMLRGIFSKIPGIKVEDGFPEKVLSLPTVAVDAGRLINELFEIGNRERGRRTRTWNIEIYAKTKSQRDDIGYGIINSFTDGIVVYDYGQGFPPTVVPRIGHLDVIRVEYTPIKVDSDLVEKMYYRATARIVATNDTV